MDDETIMKAIVISENRPSLPIPESVIEKAYQLAYERDHSYGTSDVSSGFADLIELIEFTIKET